MIPQLADLPVPERLTLKEIYSAYPDCWVVLGDLDSDPVTQELFSAVVRGHGKTRREAGQSAVMRDDELIEWCYTGRPKSPWHR